MRQKLKVTDKRWSQNPFPKIANLKIVKLEINGYFNSLIVNEDEDEYEYEYEYEYEGVPKPLPLPLPLLLPHSMSITLVFVCSSKP